MTPAQIDSQLEGDRFAPSPSSDDARESSSRRSQSSTARRLPVRADCPDWCVPLFGAGIRGPNGSWRPPHSPARPSLDLRVNRWRQPRQGAGGTGAQCSHALRARLATASASRPSRPVAAIPMSSRSRPSAKAGSRSRTPAPQLAAEIAGAEISQQVLDYCAGAGGKTLAMAAAMENRGQIFAFDAEKQRLGTDLRQVEARRYAQRAGLSPPFPFCRSFPPYGTGRPARPRSRRCAPAPGSGTWRPAPRCQVARHRPAARTAPGRTGGKSSKRLHAM